MADYHISEDEDLQKLKDWWKANGLSVVSGVVLGIILVAGNNWWREHVRTQTEQASALWEVMLTRNADGDASETLRAGEELLAGYDGTPYAAQAALLLAKLAYEAGQKDQSKARLRWVLKNADDSGIAHAARLRLARLLQDEGQAEAALELLDDVKPGGFRSAYAELRGDLWQARGDAGKARAAYREALETLPVGSNYGAVIQMKLDDLGEDTTNS
ncbi:MAG: tetratricopeptide repeat protein [Gammaproteobacteria bacterium]|jgi:predicted negative regulator of RcsB-dependent stress response|nr:tetratricopeptide repeat protein [Gammaproteobacteria bacterium]